MTNGHETFSNWADNSGAMRMECVRTTHYPIPGNDNWVIIERTTSSGTRFLPKFNGRSLMTRDGQSAIPAAYGTLTEAEDSINLLISRFQG